MCNDELLTLLHMQITDPFNHRKATVGGEGSSSVKVFVCSVKAIDYISYGRSTVPPTTIPSTLICPGQTAVPAPERTPAGILMSEYEIGSEGQSQQGNQHDHP